MPVFYLWEQWDQWHSREVKRSLQLDHEILEEVAEEFERRVKQRTPEGKPSLWKSKPKKDYIPGNLRKSWELQKTFGPNGITTATVYNDAEYAAVIEGGLHSKQAPQGMMRITVLEVPDIIAEIAARKV